MAQLLYLSRQDQIRVVSSVVSYEDFKSLMLQRLYIDDDLYKNIEHIDKVIFMKTCKKCGCKKSLDNFYYQRGGRDQKRAACKACTIANINKYRTPAYNVIIATKRRKRYAEDEVFRQRCKDSSNRYYAKKTNKQLEFFYD